VPNLFISAVTTSRQIFNSYLRTSFFVVCFLLPLSLSASTNAGRVSGKILDPRGVPVAGAHLKLLNSAEAVIREAKSDEQGSFILSDIDQGAYQLRAEEPTFVSVTLDISGARGLPMIRPGAVDIWRPVMVRYSVIYGVTR
jgi:Carboxypeptidase regulatory-like domain